MGVPELVFELKALKAKIKGVLTGHIVPMVTYCDTKLTATCFLIIGQFVDTMNFGVNQYRMVIMTHQTLSIEKYWKL